MRAPILAGFCLFGLTALGCTSDGTGPQVGEGEGEGETDAGPTPVIPLDVVNLVGFGDSVVRGYCASPGRSFFELLVENDDDAYPEYAGRDLTSHFAAVKPTNGAVDSTESCDYTEAAVRNAAQGVDGLDKPTILVITLGGNDLIHNYSCTNPGECHAYCAELAEAEVWAENYKNRMIGLIQAMDDEVPGELFIFIGNIFDPTDGVGDIENASLPLPAWPDGLDILALYNQKIVEIAEATGGHVVDVRAAMLGHGVHYNDESAATYDAEDPTYWYCANLEDPNDKGYAAIRGAFWSAIAQTLQLE